MSRVNLHSGNSVLCLDTEEIYRVASDAKGVTINFVRGGVDLCTVIPNAKYDEIIKALGLVLETP